MVSNDPAALLAELQAAEQAATPGPWWADESDECWRLHGVAFKIPPQLFPDGSVMIPEQIMNKQILKAPKHGTPYAEYWPNEADAEFIVTARSAFPLLIAAIEAVLKLHRPEMFDGRDADGDEFGSYECVTCDNGGLRDHWPCGTVLAITRELAKGESGDGS